MFTSRVLPKNGEYFQVSPATKQYIEENYIFPGKVSIEIITNPDTNAVTVQVNYRDDAAKAEWLNDATIQGFLSARAAFYS